MGVRQRGLWAVGQLLWMLTVAESVVLTDYHTGNREQCRRLCWYRAPCIGYSFPPNVIKGNNCRLHAITVRSADVPTGWVTLSASNDGITNSCQIRHCNNIQLCSPLPIGSVCITLSDATAPVVVSCGQPTPPANGAFTSTGITEGQVATLACDSGFVPIPNVTTKITCLPNGAWSNTTTTCQQVEFTSPSIPFLARFPYPMYEGWESCFKGTFLGNFQMVYNFLSDQEDYPNLAISSYKNVTLQVAFRDTMGYSNYTLFSRRINGEWRKLKYTYNMPLAVGQRFNLTFALNSSVLDVDLQGTDWSAPFAYSVYLDLMSTVYIYVGEGLTLSYVNLMSAQPCMV